MSYIVASVLFLWICVDGVINCRDILYFYTMHGFEGGKKYVLEPPPLQTQITVGTPPPPILKKNSGSTVVPFSISNQSVKISNLLMQFKCHKILWILVVFLIEV